MSPSPAAAHTKPLPEKFAGDSQFPIIGDVNRKGHTGQGLAMFEAQRFRIAGICPDAQAVIQGHQPYHRGSNFRLDPLWILNELSNIDKHRTLHLGTVYPHGWIFCPAVTNRRRFPVLTFPDARAINFSTTGARVERDTLIGHVGIEHDPGVEVELEISPSIAFTDGIVAHADVVDVLTNIQTHLSSRVLPHLVKFL